MKSLEYSTVTHAGDDDENGMMRRRQRGALDVAQSFLWGRRSKWAVALVVIFMSVLAIFVVAARSSSSSNQQNQNQAPNQEKAPDNLTQMGPQVPKSPVSPPPPKSSPSPSMSTMTPTPTPLPPTPLPMPQDSSTTSYCDSEFECKTDRLGHNVRLYSGQALCNKEYRFGMSQNGTLLHYNCTADSGHTIYEPQVADPSSKTFFLMTETAVLTVQDEQNNVLWTKESNRNIQPSPHCLPNPDLDCPYIHLHGDSVIVLNWVDSGWKLCNFIHCFENLFLN